MAGNVTVELTGDETRLLKAMQRVVNQQTKMDAGFAKAGQSGNRMSNGLTRSLAGVSGAVGNVGKAMASLRGLMVGGGAAAGFVGVAQAVRTALQDIADTAGTFEQDITPLLSLGNNVGNIDAVKDQVLGMSAAWGMSTKQIAAAQFQLQSSTANLSATIRDDLMRESLKLNKLTGVDLTTAVTGMAKTWQNYGDEVGNAARLSGMLAFAADEAVISFGELGNLLPDLLPVAKLYGITLQELIATLSTATLSLGKNDKTFTGVRNVILRLNKAQQQGIDTTGDFIDVLERMNGLPKEQLLKIFGEEAVSVIATLSSKADDIEATLRKIHALPDDMVAGKLAMRSADPNYAATQIIESARKSTENIDVIRWRRNPEARATATRQELIGLGAEVNMRDWARLTGVGKVSKAYYQLGDLMPQGLNPFASLNDNLVQVAIEEQSRTWRSQGRTVDAGALELGNMGIVDLGPGKGLLDEMQLQTLKALRHRGTAGGDEAAMRRGAAMMPQRFVEFGERDADLFRLANAAGAAGANLPVGSLGRYLSDDSIGGNRLTKTEYVSYRAQSNVTDGELNAALMALKTWANQQTAQASGAAGDTSMNDSARDLRHAAKDLRDASHNFRGRPPISRRGQGE